MDMTRQILKELYKLITKKTIHDTHTNVCGIFKMRRNVFKMATWRLPIEMQFIL